MAKEIKDTKATTTSNGVVVVIGQALPLEVGKEYEVTSDYAKILVELELVKLK